MCSDAKLQRKIKKKRKKKSKNTIVLYVNRVDL